MTIKWNNEVISFNLTSDSIINIFQNRIVGMESNYKYLTIIIMEKTMQINKITFEKYKENKLRINDRIIEKTDKNYHYTMNLMLFLLDFLSYEYYYYDLNITASLIKKLKELREVLKYQ
jgi:hypothetical protein